MELVEKKYTLNIFSNLSEPDVKDIPIKTTLESFGNTFGWSSVFEINIFIHPYPYQKSLQEHFVYIEEISKKIPANVHTHKTNGLAHGYAKSIVRSKTQYCFQLEHDWEFLKDNINHSDIDIIEAMKKGQIDHLRFNKRSNTETRWDTKLEADIVGNINICRTLACMNNPHIIDVRNYLGKYLHLINVQAPGSRGIEEMLSGIPSCAIYGEPGWPQTVSHIDGRKGSRTVAKIVGKHGFRFMQKAGIAAPSVRLVNGLRPGR